MGSNYLQNLRVLNIRSNKFWGNIPNQLWSLSSLQILDFAHNNFSGSLPSCIGNMSALLSMDAHPQEFDSGIGFDSRYSVQYAISNGTEDLNYVKNFDYLSLEREHVVIKGQLLEYSKTLHLVRIMDFSNNNLSGEIPQK
ncbi:hypothetical protein SLEP1_g38172 [Rubroshorea leprosula]|uniref:Uncharacterized protein n=1 Tax=Rubroshorea leprosula TaxID=152421 RepID=A0AAV5KXL4_9ROSI|nr:hypothetical protein SLEP1_g38172 [Rubroshorea leprosula]